uniref:Uncharacterized protein n=1 Tax=Caenorhabditis tropicalis TaxID=1561998 RepID=A0A1I7UE61_9PELO
MTKSLIDRIDEFVFYNLKYVVREILFEIVIKPEKKKTVRVLKLMVSSEGTVPRIAVDDWKDEKSVTYVSTIIDMKKKKENEPIVRSYQKIFKNPSKDELEAHFTIRVPNGRLKPVAGRQEYGDVVEWVKNTECGQVVRVVRQCDEERFLKGFKGCGLGDMCKRCSDPFDYWYTQNLPRRLYFEPFWDGIISRLPQEDFENETWKLRSIIEEEERQKPVEKKKKKVSWGFKTEKNSSDCLPTETSTVDSENNLPSTVVSDNENHPLSREISKNNDYVKYLVILFVSPILLTFVISFFFQLKW